jgi:hypothetical protein
MKMVVITSPKNSTFFSTIKVLFLEGSYITQPHPLYLGIIHAFKCHLADFEDCNHDRLGIGPRCCIDEAGCVVYSAFNSRTVELITPTKVKNGFVKCGFLIDHASSNDDSELKLMSYERMTGTVHNLL